MWWCRSSRPAALWHGLALRLALAGLYGWALPGGAASPPLPEEPIGQNRSSQPGRDTDAVLSRRSVVISRDAATVSIAWEGAAERLLVLRAGLLPDIHYLPDGRHVLLATRDGWVLRVDAREARLDAEVRVGQGLHGVAMSAARVGLPQVLAVLVTEPPGMAFLDGQLHVLKTLRVSDRAGRTPSRMAAIEVAQSRNSFITTLMDAAELWEISYNPTAPEIAVGLVHDFQYREGAFLPGYLNPQRTTLPSPAAEFWLAPDGHEVFTVHLDKTRPNFGLCKRLRLTHLDTRRKVSERLLPGPPGCSEVRDE